MGVEDLAIRLRAALALKPYHSARDVEPGRITVIFIRFTVCVRSVDPQRVFLVRRVDLEVEGRHLAF